MTEPTNVYVRPTDEWRAQALGAFVQIGETLRIARTIDEAVAAWEQWTEARSFDEHTAAATRLDAAMVALREVAT